MDTGIALCRHPLSQFSYASVLDRVDVHLLCHETKSQVRTTATGLGPDRVRTYENYDVNALVEYDAARIIESSGCAGIIALSEVDVLRAAQLRSRYGLPGLTFETARLFRDKVLMKDRLKSAGVAVPRCTPVDSGLDVREAAVEYGFPLVIKPRLGGGSVGAGVVRDEAALRELLNRGLRANFFTPAHFEAEEFVDGELCHVDGLILDGEVRLMSVSRYRSDLLEFQVPISSRMVGQDSALARRMTAFTGRVLDELGVFTEGVHTYFHCEVFDTAAGPVLCEIAARPGGLGVVDQLDHHFGVNTFELLLEAAFTGRYAPRATPPAGGFVGWIGIPVACDPAVARSAVPLANLVTERLYDRSAHTKQQISSVDLNGVLIVRGGSEDELEAVMEDAVHRLASVVSA